MSSIRINTLQSGGIITNYNCTSACAHCLYACSPNREKDYLNEDACMDIIEKLHSLNCKYIHIGGGEPFLHPDKLYRIAKMLQHNNISISYIETNAGWVKDEAQVIPILYNMISAGLNNLLVSISPFHNASIPFKNVKLLMNSAKMINLKVIPWVQDFYYDIISLDENKTHDLSEYVSRFGNAYLANIPARYWIHYGGRAVNLFANAIPLQPLLDVLNTPPCSVICDTSHFHIDLKGRYIPGLCSGFAVDMNDLGGVISPDKYPLLTKVYSEGVSGLYQYASKEYGFVAQPRYLNKCHLCTDIRTYLVNEKSLDSIELEPREFYKHL